MKDNDDVLNSAAVVLKNFRDAIINENLVGRLKKELKSLSQPDRILAIFVIRMFNDAINTIDRVLKKIDAHGVKKTRGK